MKKYIMTLCLTLLFISGCSIESPKEEMTVSKIISLSKEAMDKYDYAGVDIVDKDYDDKQSSYRIDCIKGMSSGLSYIDDIVNYPDKEEIKKWIPAAEGSMFDVYIKTEYGYVHQIEKNEPFDTSIWNFGDSITEDLFKLNDELVTLPDSEEKKYYLIESLGYSNPDKDTKDTTYQSYYIDSETYLPKCYTTYSYHDSDEYVEEENDTNGDISSNTKTKGIKNRVIYMQFYFYDEAQNLAKIPSTYLSLDEYYELKKENEDETSSR